MRTTLDLDSSVLAELKRHQHEHGGTLGEVASTLLARALHAPATSSVPLRWTSARMSAKVDLADADALERAMTGGS